MKKYFLSSMLLLCLGIISACTSSARESSTLSVDRFSLFYQGGSTWERQILSETDDPNLLGLYKNISDTDDYVDSLAVAQKYDKGESVTVFAKQSLDALRENGLELEDEQTSSFFLNCKGEQKSVILASYRITAGFLPNIPTLYMTQLFVEGDNAIVVWSHSSDQLQEQKDIIKSFTTITCI
ncbi:MAG: hypothetical protein PHU61_03110 [Candidatus Absconditabacteria bacterium]|nr:hypothetical protein [Candidatus Absconditabacteria bacterium]MDD3868229.1 hypothetical protein [Candidatus Absconditabacteria bacterium]MDD4714643.1 hypothetical protein [Candidatus Absconditabacteria bacterium]